MTEKTRHHNDGLRKICGCARRTWAKCSHAWHFSYKWAGVHYRFSLDKHLGRAVDSKTEAEAEAELIRIAIRAGTFGQPAPRAEMTLRQLADLYVERYIDVERAATRQAFVWAFGTIARTPIPRPAGGVRPFGDWRLADIVTDTIERFREARRGLGTGAVGTNRYLGLLRALYNWGVRVGYVEASPFKRGTEAVVKLSPEPSRSRRLAPDEEARVLAACAPHLRAVVEAALETGMRRGEILSLQWSQVDGCHVARSRVVWATRPALVLPWTKTKTKTERRLPISSRLRAVLEMRRFDPAGDPLPPSAYVFGDGLGRRVDSTKRAWNTAVLRAHGHEPTYTATMNLSPTSRAALAAIDLHFHDLRREAGSRWLEGGVPLHVVRDWLGHTNIAQTSTYLAGSLQVQHDAMAAFEARRASLQDLATDSQTGGRKSPRSAAGRPENPKKTGVGRDSAVM